MTARHCALRIEELSPRLHPAAALERYADAPWVALLDSGGPPSPYARHAYLCVDPALTFQSVGTRAVAGPPGAPVPVEGAPLEALRALLRDFGGGAPAQAAGLPPFLGGAAGFFAYELLHLLEEVPEGGREDFPVPDCALGFYRTVVAEDRVAGRTWAACRGFGETEQAAQREAEAGLRAVEARLDGLEREGAWEEREAALREQRRRALAEQPRLSPEALAAAGVRPVLDRAGYEAVVERARQHILAGDVFEVCTANRFDATYAGSSAALYRALRAVSEAPFGAYLRAPGVEVFSASPERFLRLDRDGWAETRPIKGTRPRGRTPEEDAALREALATSEKDRAENVMIVDLCRNDLGRVCELGTVTVPALCAVEPYPFTHQLVSTVGGRLRAGLDAVDLLRAAFPGGSITGAPKVEAMKLISRLEPVRRGVFSGSVGFLGADGAVDLNIAIRTMVRTKEGLTFHAGGAVVADSEPAAEHQEVLDKARGLVLALELARQGA